MEDHRPCPQKTKRARAPAKLQECQLGRRTQAGLPEGATGRYHATSTSGGVEVTAFLAMKH